MIGKVKFNLDKERTGLATLSALEEFSKSAIWKDISYELDIWLEDIRDVLEDSSLMLEKMPVDAANIITAKLRGAAQALRNVQELPKMLIEQKIVEKEKENGN